MAISSCEHDGFVVVYDVTGHAGSRSVSLKCPVCNMEREIEDLEDEMRNLQE